MRAPRLTAATERQLTEMNPAGANTLLQRGAVVAAGRLARPLAKATNARGLANCLRPLHSSCSGDSGGGRCLTDVGQKPLPKASFRLVASSSQQGQVVGVDPAAGDVSNERPAESAKVTSHELQEKWGWTTSDPLYWPYKIMGVFSTKNTNALSSARMLQTCLNNAECPQWYSEGKISNEFLPKLLWLSTNVWLISRRLLREGERGKRVQELLFDELWRETKRQMRSIEVSEMMLKKYLAEAQQHTFITLVQYDHAYTLESREERMGILKSALWTGIFMSDESVKESHVRVLAEYMDAELADIYAVDASNFFAACFELSPPPVAELKAARKKLAKGSGGKSPPKLAAEDLDEVFEHEDLAVEDGKKGRWRSCLAESGKVYYWHTVTREVTWEKPADCEAHISSVMPKTDLTPEAAA